MAKTVLRVLAMFLLCTLLVYAPEIYTAVSAPYASDDPERTLLRVALSTQDAQSEKALLQALNIYMKESAAVHLRITRSPADQLFSQPDPQADVFIFHAALSFDEDHFLALGGGDDASNLHSILFSPAQGEALRCAVHAESRNQKAALSLLDHLKASSAGGDDPIPAP